MSEFFAMGGYGEFVWPAYLISALVLGGFVVTGFRRLAGIRAALQAIEGNTKGSDP